VDGLRELSQGDWEGRTRRGVTRLGHDLDAWIADPVRNAAPGGETVKAAEPRVREALATILAQLASQPRATGAERATTAPWGIVVSHGGAMRVALLLLLGLPLSHFWDFAFDPGGTSIVELANARAVLRAHNLAAGVATVSAGTSDRGGAL
jgi:broad specificity phosphatase PhoE